MNSDIMSLWSITLTELEKAKVDQFLNEAQQATNQAKVQLPVVKQRAEQRFNQITTMIEARLAQVDQDYKDI